VKDFDDFLFRKNSNLNINIEGHFTEPCGPESCDFFLRFFPIELLTSQFHAWKMHAQECKRKGLQNFDESMMLRFITLLFLMADMGLSRRDLYWSADSVYVNTTAVLTLCTSIQLLCTH
jgi:hypothetical protein